MPDALLGSRFRIAQSKVDKTNIYKILQYAECCNSDVYSGRTKEVNVK